MDLSNLAPPVAATNRRVYRLVASCFPPVSVFDTVADPAELEIVWRFEALTNDRLREEMGNLDLVPPADRISGPGTTPIMAAFTHVHPHGSRFNDDTFGAYYASSQLETAVAETRHHRERFLRNGHVKATEIDMRVYTATMKAFLHDIRAVDASDPVYDLGDYSHSQAVGRQLRAGGSDGILYNSVRAPGGTCVAVFRPRLLTNCMQSQHLTYRWDGNAITDVYEKRLWPGGAA